MKHNQEGEKRRRLEQMLRVARNRGRRYGRSRRGNRIYINGQPQYPSDFHIEMKRILSLLGRHDEVERMEQRRKALALS
jgi:hypothetical protein